MKPTDIYRGALVALHWHMRRDMADRSNRRPLGIFETYMRCQNDILDAIVLHREAVPRALLGTQVRHSMPAFLVLNGVAIDLDTDEVAE